MNQLHMLDPTYTAPLAAIPQSNVAHPQRQQTSYEWHTPLKYLDVVRKFLNGIDLDPASNIIANQRVQAKRIFTIDDDGLRQKWSGKVFLNAPGSLTKGESAQAEWQSKLIYHFENGDVTEAVMLIFHVATQTQWFQHLLGNHPICLVDHRIKFIPERGRYDDENKNNPVHANAFVYFGQRHVEFTARFGQDIFTKATRRREARPIGKVIPAYLKSFN